MTNVPPNNPPVPERQEYDEELNINDYFEYDTPVNGGVVASKTPSYLLDRDDGSVLVLFTGDSEVLHYVEQGAKFQKEPRILCTAASGQNVTAEEVVQAAEEDPAFREWLGRHGQGFLDIIRPYFNLGSEDSLNLANPKPEWEHARTTDFYEDKVPAYKSGSFLTHDERYLICYKFLAKRTQPNITIVQLKDDDGKTISIEDAWKASIDVPDEDVANYLQVRMPEQYRAEIEAIIAQVNADEQPPAKPPQLCFGDMHFEVSREKGSLIVHKEGQPPRTLFVGKDMKQALLRFSEEERRLYIVFRTAEADMPKQIRRGQFTHADWQDKIGEWEAALRTMREGTEVYVVDAKSDDLRQWGVPSKPLQFPRDVIYIHDLHLDPNGNYMLLNVNCESLKDYTTRREVRDLHMRVVRVDLSTRRSEIIETPGIECLEAVNFGTEGRITGGRIRYVNNKRNLNLGRFATNMHRLRPIRREELARWRAQEAGRAQTRAEQEAQSRELEREALQKRLELEQLLADQPDQASAEMAEEVKAQRPLDAYDGWREQATEALVGRIEALTDSADVETIETNIERIAETLRRQLIARFPQDDWTDETLGDVVDYCLQPTREALAPRAAEIQTRETAEADDRVCGMLSPVEGRLKAADSLEFAEIMDIRKGLKDAQPLREKLSPAVRAQLVSAEERLQGIMETVFASKERELMAEVAAIVPRALTEVSPIKTAQALEEWRREQYPKIQARLQEYQMECPAEFDGLFREVSNVRRLLREMLEEKTEALTRDERLRERERARQMDAVKRDIEERIKGFVKDLERQTFTDRDTAERWVGANLEYQGLQHDITYLSEKDADGATELRRLCQIELSQAYQAIEEQKDIQAASIASGKPMRKVGEEYFPLWVPPVSASGKARMALSFDIDEKSKGPGVKPAELIGDIMVTYRYPGGKTPRSMRLFETVRRGKEDTYRYGLGDYRGQEMAGSYLTRAEYRTVQQHYSDWCKGTKEDPGGSKIRRELKDSRDALRAIRERIGKPNGREEISEALREEYNRALELYAQFCAEHKIHILRRLDRLRQGEMPEESNSIGVVPQWSPHWVRSPETERNLSKMAEHLKLQLDLSEGVLNLKGHAGTGKDVLVKMFCSITQRPYFAFDCTKWTTEAELGEDIQLEGGDTVMVPSVVVQAITTPGAVMYFNEFNAMPEQAQIFLHALFDEKRSVTLKTSAGKTITAEPEVLFVCSMNPGYPGTFEPQIATRSRMVSLEIDYVPLKVKDPNGGADLFNPSEAMMIARGINSLADSTFEPDLKRNLFVRIWNAEVNRVGELAPDEQLLDEQKFDLQVINALVQFGAKIRHYFRLGFEKGSREARKALKELKVSQPITLREMRRCAWRLSTMPAAEKKRLGFGQTEAVARNLIEEYFVSHIDKEEEREKLRTAMQTWHVENRTV